MFSSEPRTVYNRNPLAEVICQIRFPEILDITSNQPVGFQEAIRNEFPIYERKQIPVPGILPNGTPRTEVNHQFKTEDERFRINLSGKFIALTATDYTSWEEFTGYLDRPLASFITIYNPVFFDRIGLRYVNMISRNNLGLSEYPFKDLISPCYLGILNEDDIIEQQTSRCSTDCELRLKGGCRARIHAGPGLFQMNVLSPLDPKADREIKYIFDLDLFMNGKIPINTTAGAMETIHSQSFSIFRGAITDILHDRLLEE